MKIYILILLLLTSCVQDNNQESLRKDLTAPTTKNWPEDNFFLEIMDIDNKKKISFANNYVIIEKEDFDYLYDSINKNKEEINEMDLIKDLRKKILSNNNSDSLILFTTDNCLLCSYWLDNWPDSINKKIIKINTPDKKKFMNNLGLINTPSIIHPNGAVLTSWPDKAYLENWVAKQDNS